MPLLQFNKITAAREIGSMAALAPSLVDRRAVYFHKELNRFDIFVNPRCRKSDAEIVATFAKHYGRALPWEPIKTLRVSRPSGFRDYPLDALAFTA